MRVVGLMSGTSADGMDAAAAEIELEGAELTLSPLGSLSREYPPELRAEVEAAMPPAATSAYDICRLDTLIGRELAEAATEAVETLCDGRADLIVSHGQTIYHWVEDGTVRGTLQLGEAAWVSSRTGVPVVSNLRARDVAAGGQGAPLVALFDRLLLSGGGEPKAALNLGGIANLTVLRPGEEPLAYDTGPANALIDAAVSHLTEGAERLDRGGERATRGEVAPELLERLLDDPYFRREPPKSTGRERFNLDHLLAALDGLSVPRPDDLVATATALTAETVAAECRRYGVREVIAAGGGTGNPALMRMLAERAPRTRFTSVEGCGIPPEAKEAYAFAVLGFLSFHGLAGNVPACTGASRPVVLGDITPGDEPLAPPRAREEPARMRIPPVRETGKA